MHVEKLTPHEWSHLSKDAHLVCFNEVLSCGERIDFALLAIENGVPIAYTTCREHDSETVYMQYGGSFQKGSFNSFKAYCHLIEKLKSLGYKRVTTLIENTNFPMLKFAMKAGLLISGTRLFKNNLLIEHFIEFEAE